MPGHVELHGRFSNGSLELKGVIQPLGDLPQQVSYAFFGPFRRGFVSSASKSGSTTTKPGEPAVVFAHLRLPALNTAGLAELARQRFRLDVTYGCPLGKGKQKHTLEFVSSTGEELFIAGKVAHRL